MKKIMFNDRYGLTDAVLSGKKTMTRRMVKPSNKSRKGKRRMFIEDLLTDAAYKVGEEVAVAQCYEDAILDVGEEEWNHIHPWNCVANLCARAGLHNKMFVRADLMPHHIRITGIKVESLQDISDEDCLREGIATLMIPDDYQPIVRYIYKGICLDDIMNYEKPQEAFAALIDKVSGKGTWEKNPWVFVYEFELVR